MQCCLYSHTYTHTHTQTHTHLVYTHAHAGGRSTKQQNGFKSPGLQGGCCYLYYVLATRAERDHAPPACLSLVACVRMAKVSCSSLTLLLSEKAFCRHVRWSFSFSSFFFLLLALWFLLANSDCEVLPTVHATCGSRVSDYGTLSKLNPNLYLTSIPLGKTAY